MMNIVHLVDDCAMGGVMVALGNFEDPRLTSFCENTTLTVNTNELFAPVLDADVILIHFTASWRKLPFLKSLRLRNHQAKIVLIEHSYTQGFERWNVPSPGRFHLMLKASYGCVDEVIAVSKGQQAWLSKIVRNTKVTAIPQSRCLNAFQAAPPMRVCTSRKIVFGAIGRFHQQKGFDDLILAFRTPALDNARLVIAGCGEEEQRLRDLAAGAQNIEFLGKTDDPASFYAKIDCAVIPSRWEAFGLVATEAMAAGRMVIASDVDGLPEQVRKAGVLVEPGNVMALSYALESVRKLEREQVKAIGALARKAVRNRYDEMIAGWREKLESYAPASRPVRVSSAAALSPMPIMINPGQ